MNTNETPKVGQILFAESTEKSGPNFNKSLLFLDETPEKENSWMVTWIAQMYENDGEVEVYAEAAAGGSGPAHINRIATDDDILIFTKKLADSTNGQDDLEAWLLYIDEAEDLKSLLSEEKVRLKGLITKSIIENG